MDLLHYFNAVSAGCGIIGFVIGFVYDRQHKRESRLEDLWTKTVAAATIPTGLALLSAAFDPTILSKLPDIHLQAAAAGLATLFLAYKAFNEVFG